VRHAVADDDVVRGARGHERACGDERACDRAGQVQSAADVLRQPRAVAAERHRRGDVVELRTAAACGHVERDVVTFAYELVRGVEHQPLGAADAEAGTEKCDS